MIQVILKATSVVALAAIGALALPDDSEAVQEKPIAIELRTWSNWSMRAGGEYAWKVRFCSDGSATYSGLSFTERKGEFKIDADQVNAQFLFQRLAEYLEYINFAEMPSRYSKGGADGSHVIVRVEYPSGAHEVDDYMRAGPAQLWMLSTAMSGLADQIKWEPVEATEGAGK